MLLLSNEGQFTRRGRERQVAVARHSAACRGARAHLLCLLPPIGSWELRVDFNFVDTEK